MLLENIPFGKIEEGHLKGLVDSGTRESKKIEYKRLLPGSSDGDRKEFLFDVSSFANASGGFLIYGVNEEAGVPKELCGLPGIDADAEVRRLDSMILAGIEPRIPGLQIRIVELKGIHVAIALKIPRSWALPHMVTFKGSSKFYSRNAAGKYLLDVGELRALFLLSETVAKRLRDFRVERLSTIVANETPAPLEPGPRVALHLVPLSAFDPGMKVDVSLAFSLSGNYLWPLAAEGCAREFNFDGIITSDSTRDAGFTKSYLQLFQNGIIEAVDAGTLAVFGNQRQIPNPAFEDNLIKAVPNYLQLLEKLGVALPIVCILTLTGVKGYHMSVSSIQHAVGARVIDRDVLSVPELLLESFECPAIRLKPVLDPVWNAGGRAASPNFDDAGNWRPRP